MIKVLHLNSNDNLGGAAKASYRINRSFGKLNKNLIDSKMRVINKTTKDIDIKGGAPVNQNKFQRKLHPYLTLFSKLGFNPTTQTGLSTCLINTGLGKEINNLYESKKIDIVNLHWLGDNTISIPEIGKLKPPIVWTFHDQWPFCGTEHYSNSNYFGRAINEQERYISGYLKSDVDAQNNIKDLNRIVWLKKKDLWRKKMNIVCPSKWMENCVKKSALMHNWSTNIIPNPIDVNFWIPINKSLAKKSLNLDPNKLMILYMSSSAKSSYRKGVDLFIKSINKLKQKFSNNESDNLELLIFGDSNPFEKSKSFLKYQFLGPQYDDISLRLIYSAADLFVISSRQDNLPNIGIESHSCGTPVVAFNTGGLEDIVDNGITGLLAEPFDINSLSNLIYKILTEKDLRLEMIKNARERALSKWSMEVISELYFSLYKEIIV